VQHARNPLNLSKNQPIEWEYRDVLSMIVNNGISPKKWLSWAAQLADRAKRPSRN
jgi:hypothetical protein